MKTWLRASSSSCLVVHACCFTVSSPSRHGKVVTRTFARTESGGKKKVSKLLTVLERYEPVIGMEIHAQLSTNTKAYCDCSARYNPDNANVNTCPICLGEPGTIPVPNAKVLELASKAAMALDCKISNVIRFDRKNYFYPDTPKNYQITQYDTPIGGQGCLELPNGKVVRITRLHMEEDSAKMLHQGTDSLAGSTHSLVDFNRAGIPLAEIVSEPDIRSGAEAAEYGRELQKILRYTGASDGNMAQGSMRLDINVSIRPRGDTDYRSKVEVKNVNSFKSVQQAVDYECIRQAEAYDAGKVVRPETRMWDERELITKLMRVKEGEADYRYFPEPDIPQQYLDAQQIQRWRDELQELPAAKRQRYQTELGLEAEVVRSLTDSSEVIEYFEAAVKAGGNAKEMAKWLVGDIFGYVTNKSKKSFGQIRLQPSGLAELIELIEQNKITGKIGKELLPELLESWEGSVYALVKDRDMEAITDPTLIGEIVGQVLAANVAKVEQYRGGKPQLLGFFVGQILRQSNSRADPTMVQQLTQKALDEQ